MGIEGDFVHRHKPLGSTRLRAVLLATLLIFMLSTLAPAAFSSSQALADSNPSYPSVRFAVISDLHVYDTSLGTTGQAFEDYLGRDRKLLVESAEILETVVADLAKTDVDFILIPGDLTKDGEYSSHELCIYTLSKLLNAGKKVYVVPGNHDVSNPASVQFLGEAPEPVPSISPQEFSTLYSRFGYGEAVVKDPNSLSYVVEPVPGLWIVAMDACRYAENPSTGHPITDGKFSDATLGWLEQVFDQAAAQNKAIIGLMHHGVVEHYKGQAKYFEEYLVEDWKEIAEKFAKNNMKVVFTGHYHAQDSVVMRSRNKNDSGKFIYDVETGSLITYPVRYRLVEITPNQEMRISSRFVRSIPSRKEGFPEYAQEYLHEGISGIAVRTLRKYKVSERSAKLIAPQVAKAFEAHYKGDEIPPQQIIDTRGIGLWARIVVLFQKDLLYGLWHDLEPPDNEVTINLTTGEWTTL